MVTRRGERASVRARGGVSTWGLTASGLALVAVCYGLARFAYGLFVPGFRSAFTLDATLIGSIAAGSYLGYCVAILAAATAVNRWGPRAVAVCAGALATLGTAIVAVAPTGAILAAGVLVAGASTGVASPPMAAAIERWTSERFRDRRQAIVNAGPGVGIVVAGSVAMIALAHWRLAWACFALLAAAATWWVHRMVPPADHGLAVERRAATGQAVAGGGPRAVVADRRTRPLLLGATLFGAASTAVWTFGYDHVVQASGLDRLAAGGLWLSLGLGELVGLAAGDVIRRHGLRHTWAGALTALAGSTVALALLPSQAALGYAAMAAFGAAYVVLTSVVFFWAILLRPDGLAAAVAVGFLMIAAGQALASPLIGLVADRWGMPGGFLAAATIAAAAIAVGARTGPPPAAPDRSAGP